VVFFTNTTYIKQKQEMFLERAPTVRDAGNLTATYEPTV
jgi:hypothetical protein